MGARRGEAYYVSGCLFEGVSCLVQTLFAANARYFVNEKGSVGTVDSFAIRPTAFSETASALLECPGKSAAESTKSLRRYEQLLAEARLSCADAMI